MHLTAAAAATVRHSSIPFESERFFFSGFSAAFSSLAAAATAAAAAAGAEIPRDTCRRRSLLHWSSPAIRFEVSPYTWDAAVAHRLPPPTDPNPLSWNRAPPLPASSLPVSRLKGCPSRRRRRRRQAFGSVRSVRSVE